jgi:hypothetical protein
MSLPAIHPRALMIGLAAALGLAIAAPAAQADQGPGCGYQQVSQPFLTWGDSSSYTLVPGGSFEAGQPAWTTTGGGGVVSDNEPWGSGTQAMGLPPGSSATSPVTCIAQDTPTLRFFATSNNATSGASLQISVSFTMPNGVPISMPVGSVAASGGWNPSPTYGLYLNAMAGSGTTNVTFTFTPEGSASWEIDDVYVDPWSKG